MIGGGAQQDLRGPGGAVPAGHRSDDAAAPGHGDDRRATFGSHRPQTRCHAADPGQSDRGPEAPATVGGRHGPKDEVTRGSGHEVRDADRAVGPGSGHRGGGLRAGVRVQVCSKLRPPSRERTNTTPSSAVP